MRPTHRHPGVLLLTVVHRTVVRRAREIAHTEREVREH